MAVVDRYADDSKFWWWLVPIVGIGISNRDSGFEIPLFGDVTLLSLAYVRKTIKAFPLIDKTTIRMAETVLMMDGAHSMIAVRQPFGGVTKSQASTERALEIVGLLTLFTAVQSNWQTVVGLAGHVSTRRDSLCAFSSEGKSMNIGAANRDNIFFGLGMTKFTRKQLSRELSGSKFREVAMILTEPSKGRIHKTCRDALASAVKHLAAACYANSNTEITSAAVTCFELLLSLPNGVKDNEVKRRLRVLTELSQHDLDSIYGDRNKWLHQGTTLDDKQARRAAAAAINAITFFAQLVESAPPRTSRTDLLGWLDAQSQIRHHERSVELIKLWKHFSARDPFRARRRQSRVDQV